MKCPKCNGKTGVLDGINVEAENERLRQRCCKVCGYKFWTTEIVLEETKELKHLRYENHRSTKRTKELKSRKETQC